MDLNAWVVLAITGGFIAFMAVERFLPALRGTPQVRLRRLTVLAGFISTTAVTALAPLAILPLFTGLHAVNLFNWGGRRAHPGVLDAVCWCAAGSLP